jgi:hypothetical protein
LTPRRRLLAVAVIAVLVGGVVGEVVATSLNSTQSYYGSFVAVSGLQAPAVLGSNSGLVFFASSSGSQVGFNNGAVVLTSESVETLNPSTLAVFTIASFSSPDGVGVSPFSSFDGSGNLYYVVGFGNRP